MATILIVDDQPINRRFLAALLGFSGHRLLEAADGAEALARVQAEHPELVIADVLMPTMDGYEFVRRLRSDPDIARTPVIFYTAAYYQHEARALAKACGVSHVIIKPSDPEVIRGIVSAALSATPPPPPALAYAEFDREHLRLVTDTLSNKVDELEAVNEELEAFTYSVSHDLRAPLRHMDGFSKILLEEFGPRLDPVAQQHLQRIQEAAQHMGHLVDDLLDLVRVGRREMNVQMTSLDALVEESVADLETEAQGRQIDWQIARLPLVQCDPGLMKQVFANLLLNALKFTRPRERAVIEVGHTAEEGRAVIFVRDNGVGFDMKYADKLFGVFQRLHRQEDFEGTGVGLAIVQRIIHKHGGRLWAEAEVNKGATFYFSLALAREVREEPVPTKGGEACQQTQ